MILKEQMSYLRDKFINTSWSNPGLETNLNLVPTLLTKRFPAKTSYEVMGDTISMPNNKSIFDVYTLEYLPTEVFRTAYQYVDVWLRLDDFCAHCNALVYLNFGRFSKSVRYSDTFVCYLANGVLLIATVYRPEFVQYRDELTVYIRSSNDTLKVDIDITETIPTTTNDISIILTDYANCGHKEQLTYLIDGVYHIEPTPTNLAIGLSVAIIRDTSLIEISMNPVNTLHSYTYKGVQYYLVDLSKSSNTKDLFSFRDASIWLMMDGMGKRLVFEDTTTAMQVTNTLIAISADYLEGIASMLWWPLDGCTLRVCTKLGKPQQYYVNNDNFWHVLNNLDYNLKLDVLSGVRNGPEILTAIWQQESKYNALLDMTYGKLTKEAMDNAFCVSTWDYYLNRIIVPGNIYGNNITEIPYAPAPVIPLISYKAGSVDKYNPDSVADGHTSLRMGYGGAVVVSEEKQVDISKLVVPVIFDVTYPDKPKLLSEGHGYKTIDGVARIEESVGRSNALDLATTDMWDAAYTDRWIDLEGRNPRYATISVIVDKVTLTPYVDYHVHDKGIILWKHGVPTSGIAKVIYQPTLVPQGDCIEYGFIYDGRINISGYYLAFDPSNYYIVYDGKVIRPDEIEWTDPFITTEDVFHNGKPFAVMNPLLSNTDSPVSMLEKRKAYMDSVDEVASFKSQHTPFPAPGISIYDKKYQLVSTFIMQIHKAVDAGTIDYRPTTVANFGLNVILSKQLEVLKENLDPITHDLDWNIIDYCAHSEDEPKAISGELYLFLEKVNAAYLRGRIKMNNNYRIIK